MRETATPTLCVRVCICCCWDIVTHSKFFMLATLTPKSVMRNNDIHSQCCHKTGDCNTHLTIYHERPHLLLMRCWKHFQILPWKTLTAIPKCALRKRNTSRFSHERLHSHSVLTLIRRAGAPTPSCATRVVTNSEQRNIHWESASQVDC